MVATMLTVMKLEMFATFSVITLYSAWAVPLPGWFTPAFMGVLFGSIGIFLVVTVILGKRHA